ncbi:IHypothetical protein2 [Nesidiocoris tenuis]|uniref:Tetratricopeptide repeat protein 39C n=1 Tax=Nesidiocoris tenuis TaxID=355587 RepID=A0ABN7BB71_9HEMI|nr:IHypothetical protein2 [Nesidiocoris tenuis]
MSTGNGDDGRRSVDGGGADGRRGEEDWKVARRGIQLVLNNKYEEAQELFADRGDSIPLSAGYSYTVFMNAVMSMSEDDLEEAQNILKDLESRCSQNTGWLSAIKSKMFGYYEQEVGPYELLEQQITLADTQVLHAVLSMMNQDSTTGFVKGGWALRKAWGLYHSAYKELADQYKKLYGLSAELPEASSMWRITESATNTPSSTPATTPMSPTVPPIPFAETANGGIRKRIYKLFSPVTTPQICPDEVERLMCAVSFGYGLFHLYVSFLPPNVLRLVHFLGFASDRKVGLDALIFSRRGPDMRAPLASLALLWYHTIMNPVFAHFDSGDMTSSVEEAEAIMDESNREFSESSFFLFFRGRLLRLKNKIEEAVLAFTKAVKFSVRNEISLLCLHEVGWCYLMQLDFRKALNAFIQLNKTKTNRHFYTYLVALCYGCLDDMNHVAALSQHIKKLEVEKLCHLDRETVRRSALLMPTKLPFYYRLLVYEMLYLWDSLPPSENLHFIIQDCEAQGDPLKHSDKTDPMVGLRSLVLGVCLGHVGRTKEAIRILSSVRPLRDRLVKTQRHRHVSAFATYETAVLLVKEGQSCEARELLETALNQFSGCGFDNRLKLKIHSALKEVSAQL